MLPPARVALDSYNIGIEDKPQTNWDPQRTDLPTARLRGDTKEALKKLEQQIRQIEQGTISQAPIQPVQVDLIKSSNPQADQEADQEAEIRVTIPEPPRPTHIRWTNSLMPNGVYGTHHLLTLIGSTLR